MAEKFNLTWNDFQTNVTRSFTQLRQETDLCDVTLISDDQTQVQAHRIVLSTCSEFFRSIFKRNNHSNLVLYLSDITGNDLNIIMDYVYCGEVQIYQDRLDSFLGIAQKLRDYPFSLRRAQSGLAAGPGASCQAWCRLLAAGPAIFSKNELKHFKDCSGDSPDKHKMSAIF